MFGEFSRHVYCYARMWRGFSALITTMGLGLAVLTWSPGVVVLAVTVGSTCAVVLLVLLRDLGRWPQTAAGCGGVVETLRRALWAGTGTVALCALTGSSPPIALLMVLLLALTSPPVIHLVRREVAHGSPGNAAKPAPPGSPAPPAHPPPPALAAPPALAMEDKQICRLWRRTFWELQTERTLEEKLRLVAVRQWCLDELDRRNTEALHAWLNSGARASGGPERFWHDQPPPQDADTAS